MEANFNIQPATHHHDQEAFKTLSGDLGGEILAPGLYEAEGPLIIQDGDLTLDARGDENAVWIFKIASDFTTVGGEGGNVILYGGAKSKNVFWQTDRLATIGEGTSFKGNILSKMPAVDFDEFSSSMGIDEHLPTTNSNPPVNYKTIPAMEMFIYSTRH